MFKLITIIPILITLILTNSSFAFSDNSNFSNLDLVVLQNTKHKKHLEKTKDKKFAIIFSGSNYNKTSSTVVIVPVVKTSKRYKDGPYKVNIKIKGKEYIVLTNNLKTVSKKYITHSMIFLNTQERNQISNKFNKILK